MACWSAENATKAYLNTLKMGQKAKEPNVAEFISALAAGNNAQLMVVACASAADSNTLALVAAAHQTGGKVICIVSGHEELNASKIALGVASHHVQFMVGEAQKLLLSDKFVAADFLVIDCNLENHEEILKAVQEGSREKNGTVVVGYNAFSCRGSWLSSCGSKTKTQLLPIGEGLLVTRFGVSDNSPKHGSKMGKMKSRWVVKVDKCTGEEHVFRVRFPHGKVIQA
uniref:S-adenosyl-L-methionine-dependent methyltransferase n=1 Tax=Lotus japonicus TaxID=34305 RepID=I3T9U7_LOTJA|nr:unknown [Lotus japonicus]